MPILNTPLKQPNNQLKLLIINSIQILYLYQIPPDKLESPLYLEVGFGVTTPLPMISQHALFSCELSLPDPMSGRVSIKLSALDVLAGQCLSSLPYLS